MRKILFYILFLFAASTVFSQDALGEYRKRNYQTSVEICKSAIENGEATAQTYCILVWSLNRLKKYNEALSYGEKGAALFRNIQIVEGMGVSYYHLGDYANAMACFKDYRAKQPDGSDAYEACYYMGEIYIRNGEFNNADIALSEAVYRYSKLSSWWTRLGFAREKSGQKELAAAAYLEALRLNENQTDAKKGLERVRGE